MLNNKLFRLAGWSALVAAILMLAAMVSFPLGAGMFGGICEIIALILTIFVFYALYVAFRSQSAGLGLVGLVFMVIALAVDVASMSLYGNVILGNLWYLLFSLPFLIFGFLAVRSAKMPRVLAIGTLLIGALLFIGGVAGFLGSQAIADNVTIIPFLLILVWLVWLWRIFWFGKLAASSEKMAPAAT
jgi:hypothetical protein